MKKQVLYCLLEAYRRWVQIGSDPEKRLGERWLGLGYVGEYKSTVEGGYMVWVQEPNPRTMGWLRLTPLGEEMMRKFAARGIAATDYTGFDFQAWNKIHDLIGLDT